MMDLTDGEIGYFDSNAENNAAEDYEGNEGNLFLSRRAVYLTREYHQNMNLSPTLPLQISRPNYQRLFNFSIRQYTHC